MKLDYAYITELRNIAIRGLKRMYVKEKKRFIFCMRKTPGGIHPEGISLRYTCISILGIATLSSTCAKDILSGDSPLNVCQALNDGIDQVSNMGDVALCLWASQECGIHAREKLVERLLSMHTHNKAYPTVELSWALEALCHEKNEICKSVANTIANRLMESQNKQSGAFPHVLSSSKGLRSHVSCFADAVYPIHALSKYFLVSGNPLALESASKCAAFICSAQGDSGQWWWHYDVRTGRVIEGYPVYSVHQDAMAPMALFALHESGGADNKEFLLNGLNWLAWTPEVSRSLVEASQDLIWRKVARKEPNKLSRYLQAIACRTKPSLRIPGIDKIFSPVSIDFECRPYHLGWLLYAFTPERLKTLFEESRHNG